MPPASRRGPRLSPRAGARSQNAQCAVGDPLLRSGHACDGRNRTAGHCAPPRLGGARRPLAGCTPRRTARLAQGRWEPGGLVMGGPGGNVASVGHTQLIRPSPATRRLRGPADARRAEPSRPPHRAVDRTPMSTSGRAPRDAESRARLVGGSQGRGRAGWPSGSSRDVVHDAESPLAHYDIGRSCDGLCARPQRQQPREAMRDLPHWKPILETRVGA